MYRNKSLLVQLNLLFSDLTQKFGSLKFKDAFDLSGGYAFKSTQYKNTGVFILRVTNINEDGTIDKKDAKFIAPLNDEEYKEYQLRFGDVLIVMIGGSIGKVGFVDQESLPAFLNQNMWLVRSSKGYSQKYIFYLCLYLCHYHATEKNTSYGFYSRKKFKELIVPDISSQDSFAISSIIDKIANQENIDLNDLFSTRIIQKITSIQVNSNNINHLKSEFHNQQKYISQLKQAILQEAISGQLTAEWRKQNPIQKGDPDTDAAALLTKIKEEKQQLIADGKLKKEKHLSKIDFLSLYKLPDNWQWTKLSDIVESLRYGTSQKCSYSQDGFPVLRIPNLKNGVIDKSDLKYTLMSDLEIEGYSLRNGDILMIRSNGSKSLVGRTSIVSSDCEGYAYAGYLVRLRFIQDLLISRFLYLVLESKFVRDQIEIPVRTTTGVKNINSTEILNLIIPLPPLAEQKAIVEKVDYLMKIIDQLEAQIKHRKQLAEELMQTVLREAFE
jgi:type I restriction enzyme, S subunit